ncbi:MAG: hypothetical protein U5L06_06050 [Rhodovibrio sp.]|nr:hypothetical protein [Rhodovibrio sp.]
MSHDDFDFEPIPGLPKRPPEGEEILWQGAPSARSLGRFLFNLRLIALYSGILAAWAQPRRSPTVAASWMPRPR